MSGDTILIARAIRSCPPATYNLEGSVTSTIIRNSGGTIVFNQTQTFDELNRLLKHIGASTQTTTYAYEKNDNLKSVTDPRSGLYSYAYDSLNRLIRETDQENSQVNLTRTGIDDIATYSDPRSASRPPCAEATERLFVHDAGGNISSDTRSGTLYDSSSRDTLLICLRRSLLRPQV